MPRRYLANLFKRSSLWLVGAANSRHHSLDAKDMPGISWLKSFARALRALNEGAFCGVKGRPSDMFGTCSLCAWGIGAMHPLHLGSALGALAAATKVTPCDPAVPKFIAETQRVVSLVACCFDGHRIEGV